MRANIAVGYRLRVKQRRTPKRTASSPRVATSGWTDARFVRGSADGKRAGTRGRCRDIPPSGSADCPRRRAT